MQAAFYSQQDGKRTIVHLLNEVNTTANRAIPENNPSQREETLPILDITVAVADPKVSSAFQEPEHRVLPVEKDRRRSRGDGSAAGGAFDGRIRVNARAIHFAIQSSLHATFQLGRQTDNDSPAVIKFSGLVQIRAMAGGKLWVAGVELAVPASPDRFALCDRHRELIVLAQGDFFFEHRTPRSLLK